MKHSALIAAAGSLIALAPMLTAPGGPANADVTGSSSAPVRLQTGGGYFRDSQGRVVLLHGVNVNGDVFPNDDSTPSGFTAKDADFLAASGFNFVRLAISWNLLLPTRPSDPTNFQLDQTELANVTRVTDLLASRHIYFMLDFHQGCFDRWPAWAIPWDQGVGQGTADQSFPHCQLVPSGTTKAADNLNKDPVDPDNPLLPGGSTAVIPVSQVWSAYRESWKRMAEQYRDTDYLMGYNFINEPMTSHINECNDPVAGCPLTEEKIQAFEQNALAGIREADPVSLPGAADTNRAAIGVFEPPNLSGNSGAPTGFGDSPVSDPKAAFSVHIYCGDFAQPVPGQRLCKNLMQPAFDGTAGRGGAVRNAAHLTGADRNPARDPAPLLLSEFGSASDATVEDDTLQLADARFISWSYWEYKGFDDAWRVGLFANQADEQCPCIRTASPRADVLIRPFAQATAGTPLAYAYDDQARSLTWEYRSSGDQSSSTVIVVPQYWAPNGYSVSVTNGRVISGSNAMYLKVLPTTAGKVSVTVTAQ